MTLQLVYLADDDPLSGKALADLLSREVDLELVRLSSGKELVERAAQRPPDAVIVDASLGGVDGIALSEQVCPGDGDLVRLIAVAQADRDAATSALSRVGPLRVVDKPFESRQLLPILRAGLERRQLARELAQARMLIDAEERELRASRARAERAAAELAVTSSELATATERLGQAEQLAVVARVMSGIAHEITSQLALVGYAEALRSKLAHDHELVELCDVIVGAHTRLCAMVDHVRQFVNQSLSGKGGPLHVEPADVVAVVDRALSLLAYDRDLRARNLVKEYRARPLARLDREAFTQVIHNLVSNAVLATERGDTIEVVVERGEDEELHIRIVDRGVGMAPEVVARLGEPFFTTRGDRGSGLGVGISRRIIGQHGGTLEFWSEPGRGTVATIRLPLLPGEEP